MIRRVVHRLTTTSHEVPAVKGVFEKVFPEHWSFLLGEVALYSFVVLLVTGIFMLFHFSPSGESVVYDGSHEPLRGAEMSRAYESALRLSFDVRAGLLVRQVHHWAAIVFVAAIVGHLARIFLTGAFRRPRELNWLVGVALLGLALAAGYTGYSLLDDVLSRAGLQIGQALVMSVPVVGAWLGVVLFGGGPPEPDVIPRLYWTHVAALPALIAALIGLHMTVLLLQKHTHFPGPRRTNENVVGTRLWPRYAFETVGLMFGVAALLALLGGVAQVNPVWLYGPFRPGAGTSGAQPDWYWGWLDGSLRLFPAWELRVGGYTVPNLFFAGVLLVVASFVLLVALPFIHGRVRGRRREVHLLDRPTEHPGRSAFGAAVIAFFAMLTLAAANDVLAIWLGLGIETVNAVLRGLVLGLPPVAAALTYVACRRRAAPAQ